MIGNSISGLPKNNGAAIEAGFLPVYVPATRKNSPLAGTKWSGLPLKYFSVISLVERIRASFKVNGYEMKISRDSVAVPGKLFLFPGQGAGLIDFINIDPGADLRISLGKAVLSMGQSLLCRVKVSRARE